MSSSSHAQHDTHSESHEDNDMLDVDDVHVNVTRDALHVDDDFGIDAHQHGLVDMHEFGLLVTRTAALEQNLANLNENVTRLSDLFQQFVRNQVLGGLGVSSTAGGTNKVPPTVAANPTTEALGFLGTQGVVNMSKDLKPPVYRGEERDRNKDAVNTFLHKWSDWHALRHTPDFVRPIETSLSLEGKAYKWWMSLQGSARPTSWALFEKIFRKEFLPENEKERNWTAWDTCKMGDLSLTEYVSKYRDIILKLDGLDDFQKVRGFVRGLHYEYKAKVKTQYPKTLEDAIKSAQIYDDNLEKKSFARTKGQIASNNNNGKRKFTSVSFSRQESTKKPKGAKGPLSSDELARARKEKLCYTCLGHHQRKDCPQLRSNESTDKGKAKEKGMHTVQLLSLGASAKYSAVEVSHDDSHHECRLSVSPWEKPVGRYYLFRIHGTIAGRRVH